MDAHDIHQKDFLSSLFPPDHQHSADANPVQMFPYNQPSQHQQQTMSIPHSTPHPQLAMEMLGAMMQMQGLDSQATSPVLAPAFNPQTLLEQQFKLTQLQQLQQLQNQIFQQQIALISSQTAGMAQTPVSIDPRREQPQGQFNSGLPTPGPSAEIQAQPSIDYVSPMILNNNGAFQPPENYSMSSHLSTTLPNYGVPRGSTSAPEHIAFRHPNFPSADLDFDISPLASPWLGAHHQPVPSSLSKRSASASGDESVDQPSRKKHSPAIHPINVRKVARTSKSTNSTPLLRSRSRNGSIAEEPVGDTPSPVDLSMPPPAPPAPVPTVQESSSSSSSSMGGKSSPAFAPQFTPVTPASIMNLGRLGASHGSTNANTTNGRPIAPLKGEAKAKAAAASKAKSTHEPPSRSKRKPAGGSALVSPNLKAILPATTPTISFSANGTNSTFTPISPTTPTATQPLGPLRKTSHKAAEQKRRDSLKTTFDELRLLLPPLPLPTDAEEQSAIPILPGALPPRGPPKAGGEGPNKAVSKLQLLMCGNEYIKVLKGRVERRDEEIARLRKEVKRMRIGMGMGMDMVGEEQGMDELDLEKDLDAVEAFGGSLGVKAFISSVSGSNGMVNGVVIGDDEADDDLGEG